jgi:hypothetical protein
MFLVMSYPLSSIVGAMVSAALQTILSMLCWLEMLLVLATCRYSVFVYQQPIHGWFTRHAFKG